MKIEANASDVSERGLHACTIDCLARFVSWRKRVDVARRRLPTVRRCFDHDHLEMATRRGVEFSGANYYQWKVLLAMRRGRWMAQTTACTISRS